MSNARFGLRVRNGLVRGITEGNAVPIFLLDLYPNASAAYSLRLLRNAYSGSCIRVRRSSDNTEQNIGFLNAVLDTASLLSFVGAGNGFITTWYDQSGNGLNITQTTAGNQPRIVASGVVETMNTKPGIRFLSGNNTFLNGGNVLNINSQPFLTFLVGEATTNGAFYAKSIAAFAANRYALSSDGTNTFSFFSNTVASDSVVSVSILSGQRLYNQMAISGNYLYRNNSLVAQNTTSFTVANSTFRFLVGAANNSSDTGIINPLNSHIQELIIYQSDLSASRSNINGLINTYYGIY